MDLTINYLKTILNNSSIVVVGCSGGPDSMCLLHLLCDLKKSLNFKLIVAHMNHKQRKESEVEAAYVKEFALANKLNFEYYELTDNITSNFHSEARQIRYKFFLDVVNKYQANYLMTAHHGDDLMETILMRLARGSTLKGYSGFDLITNKGTYELVHPLIFYTKDDIKTYMDKNKYQYYLDKTNASDDYTRNRYRHHILPFLKKENKNILDRYYKFSETINAADNYIQTNVNNWLAKYYVNNKLDLTAFKTANKYLQKRIIESILDSLYPDNLYLITDHNTNEIINAIYNNKPNVIVKLPNKLMVVKEYDTLIVDNLTPINKVNVKFNNYYEDAYNIIKEDNDHNIKSNYLLRLDSKEIKLPLIIRSKRNGDKMLVKNLDHYKKINDILIDDKIPKNIRDTLVVVTDSDDNILWLPGIKKAKFDKEITEKYDIILKYIKKEKNL
jgi:tRNA(Ile)-lysidine synthase